MYQLQVNGMQEETGAKPKLAEVTPATNIPSTRDVVEVVIPNDVVLHRADSEDEAKQWANINLDYRYVVTIRPTVV